MSNISEFELDEIVLKISDCFHAPMADESLSSVECDGNQVKVILRSLLSTQPMQGLTVQKDTDGLIWLRVSNEGICLDMIRNSLVRKTFILWAEKELEK